MSEAQQKLNDLEERTIRVNALLMNALRAHRDGNSGLVQTLLEQAQRENWDNRKGLLEAGAVDSVREAAAMFVDDEDPDRYDLAALPLPE